MSRFKRRRQNPIGSSAYYSLETRNLLAGDVTVFDGDNLFIRGDSNDNQIEIIGNEDGTFDIIGRDGTTINGSSDPLVITGTTTFVNNDNNVRVSYEGGIRANFGQGNDSVLIEGVEFQGNSIIYGGPGDDAVGAFQTNFSDRLLIQTFSGDDDVSLDTSLVVEDLYVITLDGEDTVGIDVSRMEGDVFVVTGNSSDEIYFRENTILEDLLVLPQNGNDFAALENNLVGLTTGVFFGDGNDEASLTFTNVAAVNTTRVGGQANTDAFELEASSQFLNSITIATFEDSSIDDGDAKRQAVIDNLIASGARLGTVTELANVTPGLSTLAASMARTGLDVELDNPNTRLTTFAPTNDAFDNLPAGTLDDITDEDLGEILRFHVSTDLIFEELLLTLDSVTTLLNDSFTVDVVGSTITLDGIAEVTTSDIRVKNGVVHLIDEVMMPS